MQIYCYYEGGKKIRITCEGHEEQTIHSPDNGGQTIDFLGKNIYIGSGSPDESIRYDAIFFDIDSINIENTEFGFKASVIVPIGRQQNHEGILHATNFASKIMHQHRGVPKVLVKGQYIIL